MIYLQKQVRIEMNSKPRVLHFSLEVVGYIFLFLQGNTVVISEGYTSTLWNNIQFL